MIHSGQERQEQAPLHHIRVGTRLPGHGDPHQQHVPTNGRRGRKNMSERRYHKKKRKERGPDRDNPD